MIRQKRRQSLFIAGLGALMLIAAYVLVYTLEPFSDQGNLFLIDGLVVVAVGLASVSAMALRHLFDPGDAPRPIWTFFAIGLWLWTLAEAIWMYYDLFMGEVEFSLADGFYVVGYVFFALAISVQFRILFRWDSKKQMAFFIGGLALMVALAFAVSWVVTKDIELSSIVWYFYPVADIFLALAVWYLTYLFRGSALMAPWIGLFALVIADAVYVWSFETGLYWDEGGSARLVTDLGYMVSYSLFALGCFGQYLLYRLARGSETGAGARSS